MKGGGCVEVLVERLLRPHTGQKKKVAAGVSFDARRCYSCSAERERRKRQRVTS